MRGWAASDAAAIAAWVAPRLEALDEGPVHERAGRLSGGNGRRRRAARRLHLARYAMAVSMLPPIAGRCRPWPACTLRAGVDAPASTHAAHRWRAGSLHPPEALQALAHVLRDARLVQLRGAWATGRNSSLRGFEAELLDFLAEPDQARH